MRQFVLAAVLMPFFVSCQPPQIGEVCSPRECLGSGDDPSGGDAASGCTQSSQCSGLCIGGQCAQGCAETSQCSGDKRCTIALADDDLVDTVCQAREGASGYRGDVCDVDSSCRDGICEGSVCTRLCTTDCGKDAVCEPASLDRFGESLSRATCRPAHARASLELGGVTLGAAPSDEMSFTIPSGLASFTIVLLDWDGNDGQRIGFESLTTPAGVTIVDLFDGTPEMNPPTGPYPGSASVQVPASDMPEVGPMPGSWKMRVGVYETDDYITFTPVAGSIDEIRVVFEVAEEVGGVLDLNLFFSPATGLTAETAPGSAFALGMLDSLDVFYRAELGVPIGRVTYAELTDTHDTVEDAPEARDVCATFSTPGAHRVAVNVFIVDGIDFTGGFAGGIPGPPGVFGAKGSGIVATALGSGTRTGMLLAHEIGHFLALQHTTKLVYDSTDGTYNVAGYDAISDTPECSSSSIQDCADYRNAMFPFFPTSGLSFSPVQRAIVRASPILYELPLDAECGDGGTTLDISGHGFADGNTRVASGQGSCGGAGAPDRWHRYRLDTSDLASVDIEVVGRGFAPVVYVRAGDCSGTELACDSGDADIALRTSLSTPTPGNLFIAVDGRDGTGGEYQLAITEVY